MATSLPVPDVYLSERIILTETKLSDNVEFDASSVGAPASACDVLQLAARKAVGCAVEEGVAEAEPSLVLSPDCKHLAVKEPCSRRICLLSAQDGFKEVLTTLVPLPVSHDGEIIADTVLSCSWSADSRFLLVACKSSAVYLFDSTGRLCCHWDSTWSWAQLQLVAACHGPGNTILLLTAARVVFLVAHNGDKHQRSSAGGSMEPAAGSQAGISQEDLQFQQQRILQKFSVKRYHTAVSAVGYDDKSGLLVIAGDTGRASSPGSSVSPGSSIAGTTTAAAFTVEGVTVSVWQLQERQLHLKFALGTPQGGPGLLASTAATALGVDRGAVSAAVATRWSVVFSPLLEYVALLTAGGSVYLLSLTENCLVDPSSGFAGRSATTHSGSASGSSSQSPTEKSGMLRPKHVSLTPFALDAGAALSGTNSCNRSVAWWGPRVLAVAAADGSVSLVRLPEGVNILGASPARFAAGARVVANHSGSRGLLVVEPISAALASAAAGTTAAGAAAAAVANSLQLTAQEAMFAADASAAVGFSAVLAAKRTLAAAATAADMQGRRSSVGDDDDQPDAVKSSRTTAWLAKNLGVSRDELQAAATAAMGGTGGIAGWRLVLLAERTPQQLVQVHLRLKDWGSALGISRAYGLDMDAVYLARWAASPVSRATIADNLPKIRSRRAVVTECLTRVAPDYESARLLISYGLRETAKWAAPPETVAAAAAAAATAGAAAGSEFATPVKGARPAAAAASAGPPATPGGLSGPAGLNGPLGAAGASTAPSLDSMPAAKAAEVRWWRLQRLKLLALHDRLETSMALKRGSYDPEIFSVLRTEPLPKAAAALAAAGNVAGLAVLLQRHKSTLAARLQQLLSSLPESLDPRMYAALVPRASAAGAAAAAAGPEALSAAVAAAGPRVTRPVGVGNVHAKGLRKVDWVESEETFKFLAAAADVPSGAAASAAAAFAAGPHGLSSLETSPSLDFAGPALPIPVSRDSGSGDGGSSRSSSSSSSNKFGGLSSAGSLDTTSWVLCGDETAVMMHATEELERYCSVNGVNKRTLPTDGQIASWVAARAMQLDAATGQLPDALQLLELAVDKGYGDFFVQLPCPLPDNASTSSSSQAAHELPLRQLLVQGKVLLQVVKAWWPVDEQQQAPMHSPADQQDAQGAAAALSQPPKRESATAVAEAAAAALQPLWSVTLQQWVSVGLLPQLLAVLGGSSRDLLLQNLQDGVLPLLQCYPHEQRASALQHLLAYWVAAGPPAAAPAGNPLTGSSKSASGSASGSSSCGIMLAAALVSREAELLEAVAAATALRDASAGAGGSVVTAIGMHQQQQMLVARAASGDLGTGQLVWDGDVAALVAAVLSAIRSCNATNQWARVEQMLDAAADALAAAAAVNGLQPYQQQAAAIEEQRRVSSGSGSYASAAGSDQAAPEAGGRRQDGRLSKQNQRRKAGSAADGWGEDWSSEDGEQHQDAEQEEAATAAAVAAAEPLRAALLQYAVSPGAVQQLQEQLDGLRGQVRAARLLTKHGCCVSIEQVSSADSATVKDWLAKLLGRAERLGVAWPEAQWAQVWHDLLEAQQSGLSAQLPTADFAAAFLRVLLLAQQYHLAVQLLPAYSYPHLQQASTPTSGTPRAAGGGAFYGSDGAGALDLAMDDAQLAYGGGSNAAQQPAGLQAFDDRPPTAEAALAALTGGSNAMFPGGSRFGVRRALHNAAGAAVSTAVGGTAKLMGVSAHLVGSTAHLVGNTAQAVQVAGGVMGATAGLVSGTANLVSSAATFAAEAAAKAGTRSGLPGRGGASVLKGAQGLLTADAAEAVVVEVSQEMLASAASLADPAVEAAEAVLHLLPPECKAAAAQRDAVAVLRRLPEFGVSLLPAQLTSLPDKHQLLQRILFGRHTYAAAAAAAALGGNSASLGSSSSVPPWRRLGDVLELAALLGFDSADEQNEVRLMAAEAALSAGEVGVATYLSLQLAAVRYGPAWRLAAELACPQRYAAQRQQRADKVQELVQQEQQVQQVLRQSQPADLDQQAAVSASSDQQQQHQSGSGADGSGLDVSGPHASVVHDGEAAGSTQGQAGGATDETAGAGGDASHPRLQVDVSTAGHADAADAGGASTASIASPATPGGDAAPAVAAHDAANSIGDVRDAAAAAGVEDITAADIEGAKPLSAEPPADASLQAPHTPLPTAAAAAADGADASATVLASDRSPRKAAAAADGAATARLELPPKDRQRLLAFAAAFCPSSELPPLTDDLVLLQHEIAHKEARRLQQKQKQKPVQQEEPNQQLAVLLPLQQPASQSFQKQREQLLQAAVAAAAVTTVANKVQADPYKGLLSFGDPYALLAVLLSSSSPQEAQRLMEDVLSHQLSSQRSSSRNGDAGVGSSLCCLQRLLVVAAAAQLLLLLQPLPESALVEVVAGVPSSRASCSNMKLLHHQELLVQLLHVPLGHLQSAANRLLQLPPQQQVLPAGAAGVVAAAAGYVSRLQQIADGRQLLQWLPGIETGRFFAGDKPYQEQVLIQLASKAGQMAMQPDTQQQQKQQQQSQQAHAAAAEALMAQAQQLAASYGADPFLLGLWFVHSLILYAPDIMAPEAQALLAAHTPQLMLHPAGAIAHLYYNTYPLLPGAAAGHCSCVLGLINTGLQTFCAQQQKQQQQTQSGINAGASNSVAAVPGVVTAALPQLDKMKDLLVKSSKALSGLAAKALIGGHVALMVGPAVAAATALAAATTPGAAAATGHGQGKEQQLQQQQGAAAPQEAAVQAAAAAVAGIDLPMVILEASSAVSAFVTTPNQAAVAAKFIRHLNTLAEMHARASVGDKAKQQMLQKLAQSVSPGLPHLLLLMKTMSGSGLSEEQQQQQQYWADAEERSEGLTRVSSADSFQSATSVGSSLSGGASAHPSSGHHHSAAALAIEWATARARYASSSGRQQLLNCSALQLSGLAGWLALGQQQPLPEDAVGQLRPLAMGPGLRLQILTDIITLISNPEAQLLGLSGSGGGSGTFSSGGSSRSSSFQQAAGSAEQAAATAVAAAAALAAGPVASSSRSLTALMRDDPAAIAAWRAPNIPTSLAPKRRELVTPLLQAAVHVVARHLVTSAVRATATAAHPAIDAAVEEVAAATATAAVAAAGASAQQQEQQQQQEQHGTHQIAQSAPLQDLLTKLVLSGNFSAHAALHLVHELAALQAACCSSSGGSSADQQHGGGTGAAGIGSGAVADITSNSSSSSQVGLLSDHDSACQQATRAVSHALRTLTQAALAELQQQLAAEPPADSTMEEAAGPSLSPSGADPLNRLQLLVSCLGPDPATNSPTNGAAAGTNETDSAAAQLQPAAGAADGADADAGSWVADSMQQLRHQLWEQLQQYQAQLPAEAYGNRLVAELLELQEAISSGAAWPGWATSAGGGAGAGTSAEAAGGGGRPKSSGAGLLLARTMTALGKQFPGLKASADDVASVDSAVALFTGLVSSATDPLTAAQFTALTNLLTDVWKEGAALPQPASPMAQTADAAEGEAAETGQAVQPSEGVGGEAAAADEQQGQSQQQQQQEAVAEAVGLAVGSCRVSQLHSCWHALLAAMLSAGYVQGLLALLDTVAAATAAASCQQPTAGDQPAQQQQQQQQTPVVLPVAEAEAQQLVAAARTQLGCAGEAVVGLLLPYRSCQQAALDQLLQGKLLVGAREAWAGQLLLLLLLRGQLPQIAAAAEGGSAANSDPGTTPPGSTTQDSIVSEGLTQQQQQQLYHLYSLLLEPVLAVGPEGSEVAWAFLTCLFPHAIAQLCLAPDFAAAAGLVASKMRLCGSLCTFNGSLLLLQRYLEVTMQRPWQPPSQPVAPGSSPLWLPCCEAWLAANGAAAAATAHTRLLTALRAQQGDAG